MEFKINQHVSKTGINFLKLVNQDCTVEIDPRPQIYLTEEEKNSANSIWNFSGIYSDKIVIAPILALKNLGEMNFCSTLKNSR